MSLFSKHIHSLMTTCDMASFCLPCPEIGQFAYVFEPMEILDGQWVTNKFYLADSVTDCLRKQAAMHRYANEQRGVAESAVVHG